MTGMYEVEIRLFRFMSTREAFDPAYGRLSFSARECLLLGKGSAGRVVGAKETNDVLHRSLRQARSHEARRRPSFEGILLIFLSSLPSDLFSIIVCLFTDFSSHAATEETVAHSPHGLARM